MLSTLIITDLIQARDKLISIAGVNEEGCCIRPVFRFGRIPEKWLWENGELLIYPGAHVEFTLLEPRPQPPHTEDWIIVPGYHKLIKPANPADTQSLLKDICFPSVQDIFEGKVHQDFGTYILAGEGSRSLGTVEVQRINWVTFKKKPQEPGKWEYRLDFTDASEAHYNLAVTDLTMRYFCDYHHTVLGQQPGEFSSRLFSRLRNRPVYLRIGVTRGGWGMHPDHCHLQINGVYSFPSYCEDKTLADFQVREPDLVLS